MGTFERIRKISPYALGFFALAFIGFMVASDADISSLIRKGQNPQTAAIATINGEELLYKDYEERVRMQIEQMRGQSQNPEEEIDETRIRQQVWNEMLEGVLLQQEADKAGIKISKEEIADAMIENPPDVLKRSFTDTSGRFMKEVYLELVTNPEKYVNYMGSDPSQIPEEEKKKAVQGFRNQLIEIGDYIRKQKLGMSLMTLSTTSGALISPTFASLKFNAEKSVANVNYIHVDAGKVDPKSIKITDSEIQKYYDDNKQYFKQKPSRKVKYVNFPMVPSSDDSARSLKRVQSILKSFNVELTPAQRDSIFEIKMGEYGGQTFDYKLVQDIDRNKYAYMAMLEEKAVAGPIQMPDGIYFYRLDGKRIGTNEVVKASHILIKFDNNKDSAKAIAESIMKRAKAGEDFAELATTLSQDKGSAETGGDVGFFGKGKMVKEFDEAAFAAKVGDIVGPVETKFGYHIIKVTDRKSEEMKFSEIKIAITTTNTTKNAILREAFSFSKQVEAGANFDTLAKKLKRGSYETPFFEKNRPLFSSQYLTDMAFETEVGSVVAPYELKKFGVVVMLVTDKREAGIVPLADKKEEITARLTKIKQLDAAKAMAMDLYSKVKPAGSLNNLIGKDSTVEVRNIPDLKNNGNVPVIGRDFAFTGFAYKLPVGGINEPVRCENGYFIIEVISRNVPNDAQKNSEMPAYIKQLRQTSANQAFSLWFQSVKDNAKIEDERSKFFKEY